LWNADGNLLVAGENVNGNLTFKNNWSTGGGIGFNQRSYDDRLTRGGPIVLTEGFTNIWSWLNTDNRRRVSLNMFNGAGFDGVGSWYRDHELEVTYRPMS